MVGHSGRMREDCQNATANAPLTHQAYSIACSRIALATRRVARPFVQVRRRGAVLCGQVKELAEFAEGGDWFKVETQVGTIWAESRNIRLCSVDGRCTCEVDGLPAAVRHTPRAQRESCVDSASARSRAVDDPRTARVVFFQAGVVAPPEGSISGIRAGR